MIPDYKQSCTKIKLNDVTKFIIRTNPQCPFCGQIWYLSFTSTVQDVIICDKCGFWLVFDSKRKFMELLYKGQKARLIDNKIVCGSNPKVPKLISENTDLQTTLNAMNEFHRLYPK